MDTQLIAQTLTFADPGEFQFWNSVLQIQLKNGLELDASVAIADRALKATRARVPIITTPPTTKQ